MRETSRHETSRDVFLASVEEFVRGVRRREDDIERLGELPPDIVEEMASVGLFRMLLPTSVGGLGLDMETAAAAMMRIGTTHPAVRVAMSGTIGLAGTILAGELERLEREARFRNRVDMIRSWLERMASGRMRAALAMSEPVGGSRLELHRTEAAAVGDRWRLDGFKAPVTEGGRVGLVLVLAITEPGASLHRRFSLFAVERDEFDVAWQTPTWASRAHWLAGLSFEGVSLPRHRIVGPSGWGLSVVSKALVAARLLMSASAVGLCRRLVSETALKAVGVLGDHVGGTVIGPLNPLGSRLADLDAVQVRLGSMVIELESARSLVESTVRLFDDTSHGSREPGPARSKTEKDQRVDRRFLQRMVSATKVHVSDTALHLADDALALMGAESLLETSPVGLFLRQARILPLVEGASPILRKSLAGSLVETATAAAQRAGADDLSRRQARFEALAEMDFFFDGP